jgi:alpha-N-acetylglucosamine transferase
MILDRWEPMKLVNRSQLGFEYKYLYVFPPASLDLASVQQKFEGVEVEQVGISTFRFG